MSDLEEAAVNEGDPAAWSDRVYGRAGVVDEAQHPPASPHLLIRASAGTGKTYRLTTRYLRLLRAGESAEHILATTFTRKAAGEVLGRVLGWLARSVVDPRERGALDDALGGFGLSERDCLDMLRRLVDGLNRLAIGTIDSFFNRAARALRFELDIPAEPTIADDGGPLAQALRLDAIQQTLGEAAATDDGFQTLIELLRRVHHDTARRSVTEAIDGLVVGLYDIYRQHDAAALWSTLNPPPTLSTELLHLAVQDVVALGEQVPVTKKGAPRASWSKAYKQLSDAALRHDFDTVLSHTLCQRLLDDELEDSFDRCEIPAAWREALMPILTHARAQTLRQLAEMTESTYHLLNAFTSHYENAKRSAGVLMFSDLTHKLATYLPTLGDDLTTEFYYRLDSSVTHLLLDEFQDTSLPQWKVLEPFADEVTAAADGERSFFCVGDEKQAIYGWRGGCAELFGAVEQLPGVTPWTMTRSRRSSPVVLDAVNQVFCSLTQNAALQDEKHGERWDAAVAQWAARFETHAAHDETLPGHVVLKTTAPKAADESDDAREEAEEDDSPGGYASPHEAYCAEYIAALVAEVPDQTVGVLVRRKKAATGLLSALRAMGVGVSEEGGNPIDHTPAVSATLAAVRLADHPGDRVAAFHVANSPMGVVVGLTAARPTREAVARVSMQIRRALLDRGFGETVAGWCRAVAPSCDARSLRRMEQLVSLAQQYDQDAAGSSAGLPGAGLRVGGFVEVVRQARVQSPTPAAVRVMTLHAAKGLEFDTVVLPDLDASLSQNDNNAQVMLDRDSPMDEPRAVVRRVDRKKLAAVGLEGLADREDALRRGEDLCLLYVGMTRAKHALHLLVRPLAETKGGLSSVGRTNLSYAAILRQAFVPDSEEGPGGNEVLYESGDAHWAGHRDAKTDEDAALPQAVAVKPLAIQLAATKQPARSRPVRLPSDGAADATVNAADLLKLSNPEGRSFGSAMHAVCERLGFVDEEEAPDALAIADAIRLAGVDPTLDRVSTFVQQLEAMLDAPPVREALSRQGAADLWRERAFAVVREGNLLRGVFDRVHVWRDAAGNATRARLIDFKTDRLPAEPDGADQLAEHYRPQLDAYRKALSVMLKLDVAAIEAALVLTGEALVVTLLCDRG